MNTYVPKVLNYPASCYLYLTKLERNRSEDFHNKHHTNSKFKIQSSSSKTNNHLGSPSVLPSRSLPILLLQLYNITIQRTI